MYTCKKKLAYILEWTKLGWMFWRENSNHFCTLLSKIEGQKFWNGQKTPYTTSVHSNSYISKKHIHVRKKWDAFQTGPRLCKVVLARKFKLHNWPIFPFSAFWTGWFELSLWYQFFTQNLTLYKFYFWVFAKFRQLAILEIFGGYF